MRKGVTMRRIPFVLGCVLISCAPGLYKEPPSPIREQGLTRDILHRQKGYGLELEASFLIKQADPGGDWVYTLEGPRSKARKEAAEGGAATPEDSARAAEDRTFILRKIPDNRQLVLTGNKDAGVRIEEGGQEIGRLETLPQGDAFTDNYRLTWEGKTYRIDGQLHGINRPWIALADSGKQTRFFARLEKGGGWGKNLYAAWLPQEVFASEIDGMTVGFLLAVLLPETWSDQPLPPPVRN
jgi:hypothetical protein